MKNWIAVASLLFAVAAFGQTTAGIYRVLPPVASTDGGTKLVFKFTGSDCPLFAPPGQVKLNGVAVPTESSSCYEIVATLPARAPGPANVTLEFAGESIPVTPPIQYIDPAATPDLRYFDRILVPLFFSGPGAFGSFWQSEGELRNMPGNTFEDQAPHFAPVIPLEWFYDVNRNLCPSGCPAIEPYGRLPLEAFGARPTGMTLFVPKETQHRVVAGARVRDISRAEGSWGAELPIAREEDFRSVIVLPNVPVDDRYRATLRIYGVLGRTMPAKVEILTADGRRTEHLVSMQGPCGQFVAQCNSAQPGYAVVELSSLVAPADGPVTLEIGPEFRPGPSDLWAFVSVTNKTTQHVTTIRPQ
jgi:hypothetical protein